MGIHCLHFEVVSVYSGSAYLTIVLREGWTSHLTDIPIKSNGHNETNTRHKQISLTPDQMRWSTDFNCHQYENKVASIRGNK